MFLYLFPRPTKEHNVSKRGVSIPILVAGMNSLFIAFFSLFAAFMTAALKFSMLPAKQVRSYFMWESAPGHFLSP